MWGIGYWGEKLLRGSEENGGRGLLMLLSRTEENGG